MDYEKLKLKCGIEIHQQLEGKKLFCNCPCEIRKDKPHFEVERRLRVSSGESGNVDKAASHEASKQKYFKYKGYEDTTCLVELDEEPPRSVNKKAMKTALEVARMLNCHIIDEIQFMRKTVIDGSNTSGFQRTALVGINGYIEVDGKKYGVESLCLEEEACQVIQRGDEFDVYNLSRLGIPLLEIATAPDIKSPEEASKVAGKIGMILRSTGKAKRGIGSIRQDVNLSIMNGARVEIKGFQDLKSIKKVMDNEIERQLKLVEGKGVTSEVRKAESDFTTSFLRPMPGADRMYPETDVPKIIPNLDNIKTFKLLDEKAKDWEKKYKIPTDYAKQLIKREIDFDSVVEKYTNLAPKVLANVLTSVVIELRRKFEKELELSEIEPVFEAADQNKIPHDSISAVLEKYLESGDYCLNLFKSMGEDEIKAEIQKVLDANPGAPMGLLMGRAMSALKGKAEGKKVSELVRKMTS